MFPPWALKLPPLCMWSALAQQPAILSSGNKRGTNRASYTGSFIFKTSKISFAKPHRLFLKCCQLKIEVDYFIAVMFIFTFDTQILKEIQNIAMQTASQGSELPKQFRFLFLINFNGLEKQLLKILSYLRNKSSGNAFLCCIKQQK